MQLYLVSYTGGMFGEFFCSVLNQNPIFYGSENFKELATFRNSDNRWLFPEYLSPINLHAKTMPSDKAWNINDQQKQQLQTLYDNKDIIVPTHWYQHDLASVSMPARGIRLYCSNPNILLLSYILFWIKSHVIATDPWPSRIQEMQDLIVNNHEHADRFKELLIPGQYHSWKFLSYRYNILLNGQADLQYFVRQKWEWLKKINKTFSDNWYNLDISNVLHGDQTHLEKFEKQFDVHLDRTAISEYTNTNISIIETRLGTTLPELGNNWQQKLLKYINERI